MTISLNTQNGIKFEIFIVFNIWISSLSMNT